MRGGPLSGYCQPVEIRAPRGARIAPAACSSFLEGHPDRLLVGRCPEDRIGALEVQNLSVDDNRELVLRQLEWLKRQLFGEKSEKRLDIDPAVQGNLLSALAYALLQSRGL